MQFCCACANDAQFPMFGGDATTAADDDDADVIAVLAIPATSAAEWTEADALLLPNRKPCSVLLLSCDTPTKVLNVFCSAQPTSYGIADLRIALSPAKSGQNRQEARRRKEKKEERNVYGK